MGRMKMTLRPAISMQIQWKADRNPTEPPGRRGRCPPCTRVPHPFGQCVQTSSVSVWVQPRQLPRYVPGGRPGLRVISARASVGNFYGISRSFDGRREGIARARGPSALWPPLRQQPCRIPSALSGPSSAGLPPPHPASAQRGLANRRRTQGWPTSRATCTPPIGIRS